MSRIRIFIFFLFLLYTHLSYAQPDTALPVLEPSYIHNFSDFQAGPSPRFKDFFEGKNGRIWLDPAFNDNFLLAVHLFELDGYDFFPIELNDPDITGTISFLVGMTKRNEIIGYSFQNLVFLFNLESKTLKRFEFDSILPGGEIKNVILAKDGSLLVLVTDDSSLYLYSIRGDEIRKLAAVVHPVDRSLFASWRTKKFPLLENEHGVWFMGNRLPLYHYRRETEQIEVFDLDQEDQSKLQLTTSLNTKCETQLIEVEGGLKLFFPAYDHALFNFNYSNGKIQQANNYPIEWKPQYLATDKQGNLLELLKDKTGQYHAYLTGPTGERMNYSNFVKLGGDGSISQMKSTDFTKQVIINRQASFISSGVRNRTQQGITSLSADRFIVFPQDIPAIPFLVQDRSNGLYSIQKNEIVVVDPDTILANCAFLYIQNGFTKHAVKTPSGKIWLIHTIGSGGIVGLNYQDQICENYPMKSPPIRIEAINDSTLILLRKEGLFYFDTGSGTEKPVIDEPLLIDVSGYTFGLLLDSQQNLWVSTSGGLLRIDIEEGTQQLMGKEVGSQDLRFHDLYEGKTDEVFLGSVTGGLYIYDMVTEEVQVIDFETGLANKAVRIILQDDEGYLWVGTQNGLSLISPDGEVVRNFYQEDGLAGNDFIRGTGYQEKNGRLLFSTTKGLVLIDPQLVKKQVKDETAEKPILTELRFFDTEKEQELSHRVWDDLPKDVTLTAAHRYLHLKFALPNTTHPMANRFAYMLEGEDKDWIYLGTQHELNLSRLPVGKYRLLIKGADYRNNWSKEPLAIQIHAREFFFKQSWFYVLCGILMAGVATLWIGRLRFEKRRLEEEVQERTREISLDKALIEQQADKLQQANEMQSRFFTNISHELRTPITLIGTPIEQILQKEKDSLSPQLLRSLGRVQHNTQKLNGLVGEILELSKLETGKVELQPTPVPFTRFIQQLFSAFESQAVLKNIDYTIHSEIDSNSQFLLDRGRLSKIVNNLLSNALKFTPTHRSVRLELKAEVADIDKALYDLFLSVKDTGRGIPSEDLPYVFDRYFQTKQVGLPTEGGTGIGLALSRELARLMGGELEVKSEWGSGSTFTLQLKAIKRLAEVPESPNEAMEPTVLLAATPTPKNNESLPQVLVVEDNPDMQELLLSLLEDDYNCQLANNGVEALAILQQDEVAATFQLVISDVMMPEMDGYTLLKQIKEAPHLQSIPIIMLTARTAEEDKLRALRLGVDDYLGKPFSTQELLARSANLIQRYQLRLQFQSEETKASEEVTPPSANQLWLQEIEQVILAAIDKKIEIGIPYLAYEINLGDRQLLRRLKSLTGLTTNQYIQEIKLQHARRLLEQQAFFTVSEVAYASGFSTPAYFSKLYEKRFGKRPIEYFEPLA